MTALRMGVLPVYFGQPSDGAETLPRPPVSRVNPVATAKDSVYVHLVKRTLALPDSPAVVAGFGHAAILTPDGEVLTLPTEEAAALLRSLPPPILVHAPATFRRLGLRPGPAFDLIPYFEG